MKKVILLILVFILTIQITLAVCCVNEGGESNCFPEKNVCCEGSKKIPFVGCRIANKENPDINKRTDFTYACPNDFFPAFDPDNPEKEKGACLQCIDKGKCNEIQEDCVWEKQKDKCKEFGGTCYVNYLEITDSIKLPSNILGTGYCTTKCDEGEVYDKDQEECVEKDGTITCDSNYCIGDKECCLNGKYPKNKKGAICSGDNDDDDVCNYYDNCIDVENENQLDRDGDCLNDDKTKTSLFGKCGDACDAQDEWCESAYTTRQCCNDEYGTLGITIGVEPFYGFFDNDCPQEKGTKLGCWASCKGGTEDEVITYEAGKCIDGEKIIKVFKNGVLIETKKEPCSGIPLIPFFTNLNLIFSLLILTLFYFFKER